MKIQVCGRVESTEQVIKLCPLRVRDLYMSQTMVVAILVFCDQK